MNILTSENPQFGQDFCNEEMKMSKAFIDRVEILTKRLCKMEAVILARAKKKWDDVEITA